MGVPANTLSRRVKQLETHLDTQLMQRSTRKLTLTSAGRTFFERSAPAIDGVLHAGQELVNDSHAPSGAVRVAAPAGFLESFKMEWVAEFLVTHPRIRLEFVLEDAVVDLIADSIDLAFRSGPTRGSTFTSREIVPNYFTLVASPAYLAARGTPASLLDLAKHDCLTFSSRQNPLTWRLTGPNGNEELAVHGRFSANDARALLKGCLCALGIALLPTVISAPEIGAGRLITVLPGYRHERLGFHMVFPNRQRLPAATAAFAEFAERRLRTLQATAPAK